MPPACAAFLSSRLESRSGVREQHRRLLTDACSGQLAPGSRHNWSETLDVFGGDRDLGRDGHLLIDDERMGVVPAHSYNLLQRLRLKAGHLELALGTSGADRV
jgi:hypothetical protein